MELAVYNISGKDTGKKVKLSKKVFGAESNDHAIYLDVKQYLANQRQGTHKTKINIYHCYLYTLLESMITPILFSKYVSYLDIVD